MSTPVLHKGQEPKRRRGHLRVAAIMETGMALFAEKGFAATTMTEIAQRSGTATASLYRFFPSKEALADALAERITEAARAEFDGLRSEVVGMATGDLALRLVRLAGTIHQTRRLTVDLAQSNALSDARREEFRAAFADGMARVLCAARPGLPSEVARVMGRMLLGLFRGVRLADPDWDTRNDAVRDELTALIRHYLEGRFTELNATSDGARP
jgi:AcrR family transcriptional regulator